jgi:hypothetical protein
MAATPDTASGHWSTLVEGLQLPPLEFYASIEAALTEKRIPDATVERIEYREGGAFSAFRTYLRIRRHREVFDVCTAPFGNGCFFSWWQAEVRPRLPTIASVFIVLGYLMVAGLFSGEFGAFRGPVVLLLLLPLALYFVSRMGTQQADDVILMLPWIGWLYERLFRPITYYRIDTSDMFQTAVRQTVMGVIDRVTEAKGIRALTELERKPVMRDFFRK